jgi:hypothetical protein
VKWRPGLAVFFATHVALAQAVIVPPKAHETKIAYPERGRGDAVVILEIIVSPEGRVVEWHVLAGGEPFLSAVKAAIESMTFDPATRDGRPITARMRIELPFHEEKVEAPVVIARVEHVETPLPKPKPKPKPIAGVEDVHVQGTRKEIGGATMSKEDVRDLPGAFGDAFRAIDMMPGVTPIISGVPYFFVRGAPPGNTGYYLDDVRVPLLFHLALGPSVVHPSLVDRVDFYPGGFPAQYGRYTGGIVAGETRGPSSRIGGEVEARLFDAGVLGETPFANGKGSALVSGRYGYPALLLPIFAPDNQLAYWDYQARVTYRVKPRDTLTAFVFGSFDELDQRDTNYVYDGHNDIATKTPFYPLIRTEFHRADLRWDHAVAGGNLRTALTLGVDDSLNGSNNATYHVIAENIQLRSQLDRKLTSTLRLRTGADVVLNHYDYSETHSFTGSYVFAIPTRNDVVFGGYADVVWRVDPRIEIVPGLRFDVFTSRSTGGDVPTSSAFSLLTGDKATAAPALDPRLATRVSVTKRLAWLGTLGLTHQPPSLVPIPGVDIGTLSRGLQSAVQASQGFEAKLPWDIEFKSTFFIQRYFDMTNALQTCTSIFDSGSTSCIDQRLNGRGIGLETMLKRSFSKRIGGWISYTFSRASVTVPHPHPNEPSEVPSNFDRTHVFNSALAFDFGRGWHAGARFTYYTGLPYTKTFGFGTPIPPYNGYRLPDFWRIDVRLEKRWRVGPRAQVAVFFEGLNITFNKEAIAIQCTSAPFDRGQPTCAPQMIGPVAVPSIGFDVKY